MIYERIITQEIQLMRKTVHYLLSYTADDDFVVGYEPSFIRFYSIIENFYGRVFHEL